VVCPNCNGRTIHSLPKDPSSWYQNTKCIFNQARCCKVRYI